MTVRHVAACKAIGVWQSGDSGFVGGFVIDDCEGFHSSKQNVES
jgi:hypothetical protein